MTTTPTSGAADLPEALRSIQRFEVVDCIDDKHVPAVIPKPHGPWVRYEDHVTALKAAQPVVTPQPGAAYAALPEPITYQIAVLKACEHGDALVGWRVEPSRQSFDASMRPKRKLYTEGNMHDFADRTHALRASHGQAPAQAAPQPSPAAQGDALPREDFAWLVVQEACETEPADEDDPECVRILRRDLKSSVLAAFLRLDAARAAQEGKSHGH